MFGRMMVTPSIVQVGADADLQAAITALLQAAEHAEIVRWIEFPASVLLFLLVPGNPESGALYILDRKQGTWYAVDFDDEQFGGYSVSQLEQLLRECQFLDLVERPGFGEQVLDGGWSQETRRRRAFDRRNIPGYLPTAASRDTGRKEIPSSLGMSTKEVRSHDWGLQGDAGGH